MARTRALYEKLLRLCAEVEHQAAEARTTLAEDPSDEVAKELLRPGGSLAAFSDAHRIIVIDALRTDFQGIPAGCGAGERAKDVEAECQRRAVATGAPGAGPRESAPGPGRARAPEERAGHDQELGPPIPPGWHSEMALSTLLGVDKKLFLRRAKKAAEGGAGGRGEAAAERGVGGDIGAKGGAISSVKSAAGGEVGAAGGDRAGDARAASLGSAPERSGAGASTSERAAAAGAPARSAAPAAGLDGGESSAESGQRGNKGTPRVAAAAVAEDSGRDAAAAGGALETDVAGSSDDAAPPAREQSGEALPLASVASLEPPPPLPAELRLSADPARALLQRRQLRLVQVLSAYALHDPETGYCQGMADLAAVPVLVFAHDDALAWAATERLMRSARANFRHDETGIRMQLAQIAGILRDTDPALFARLRELDCADCTFAYRMVVVRLRRELRYKEVLTLWEMSWAGDLEQQRAVAKARERAERRARREAKAERQERGERGAGREGAKEFRRVSKPHKTHGEAAHEATAAANGTGNGRPNGGHASPTADTATAATATNATDAVRPARKRESSIGPECGKDDAAAAKDGGAAKLPPGSGTPAGPAAQASGPGLPGEGSGGAAAAQATVDAQSSEDDGERAPGQAWRAGRAANDEAAPASPARDSSGSGSDTSQATLSTASSIGAAPHAAPNDLADRRRAIVEAALVENAMPLTWSQRLELPASLNSGLDSASSAVLANGEASSSSRGGSGNASTSAPASSPSPAPAPPVPASARRARCARGESFSRAEPPPPDLVVHFVVAVVRSQRSGVLRRCRSLDDVLRLFNSVKIDFWLSLAQARKQFKAYNQGLAVLRRA